MEPIIKSTNESVASATSAPSSPGSLESLEHQLGAACERLAQDRPAEEHLSRRWMVDETLAETTHEVDEAAPPVGVGLSQVCNGLCHHAIDDCGEQRLFVLDMVIQRHRCDTAGLGHSAHGEPAFALGLGDLGGPVDHFVDGQVSSLAFCAHLDDLRGMG